MARPLFSNTARSQYHCAPHLAPAAYPPALKDARSQVLVVGGGMTGLSAALHAARAGYEVTLIDAERVGHGASTVNGGAIVPNTAPSVEALRRFYGDKAQAFYTLACQARDYAVSLIGELGIEADLRLGSLQPARNDKEMALLEAGREALTSEFGATGMTVVGAAAVRDLVRTDRYVGGVLHAKAPHLDPLKFTLGMARAAEAAGVRIHEGTRAKAFSRDGAGVVVETEGGVRLRADHLLLATNAYIGKLSPVLARRLIPMYFAMIGTAPLSGEQAKILREGLAVGELIGGAAYRMTAQGSLVFGGGRLTTVNNDLAKRALRKALLGYFPQLAEVEIPYVWGGMAAMGKYFDLPDIGRLDDATSFAQTIGFGWGPFFGKAFADSLKGDGEAFDFLAGFPKSPVPLHGVIKPVANLARIGLGVAGAL